MDAKTRPLQHEWLEWWRERLRIITDGGYVITSVATFQVSHQHKEVRVILQAANYPGSDVQTLNNRCVEAIGWRMVPMPETAGPNNSRG